jgi:hypothetical protein
MLYINSMSSTCLMENKLYSLFCPYLIYVIHICFLSSYTITLQFIGGLLQMFTMVWWSGGIKNHGPALVAKITQTLMVKQNYFVQGKLL